MCRFFLMDVSFQLIWVNTKEHDCWLACKKWPNCLPKGLYDVVFPLAIKRVLIAPCPYQHLVSLLFKFLVIPIVHNGILAVSICNFLMTCNTEHLFRCLFVICMYLLGVWSHFIPFLIDCFHIVVF